MMRVFDGRHGTFATTALVLAGDGLAPCAGPVVLSAPVDPVIVLRQD
jgi:hypothetical protein